MIKGFRHACILISDLNKSLKFYRDILGFKVSKVTTLKGKYPEAVLGIKGIRITYVKLYAPNQAKKTAPILELHYWKNPKKIPKKTYNHISFTVEDIDYEYQRLRNQGVKFISHPIKPPYRSSKLCFAYDPDGNLIEFIEGSEK